MFDGVISEGIATYFEAEYAKNREEKTTFIKTIVKRTDEENEIILTELRPQLNSNSYNYAEIFFDGNEKLPRWAGYSLGYYLVKEYLKNTGGKSEDIFTDNYADFRVVLKA